MAESSAPWRKTKFTLEDFLARQVRKGCLINPIFAIFGMSLKIFRIDWLFRLICFVMSVAISQLTSEPLSD